MTEYCPVCGEKSPGDTYEPFHTHCAATFAWGIWSLEEEEFAYCHRCGRDWHKGVCDD